MVITSSTQRVSQTLKNAKILFHQLCVSLWNAEDVETVCVMITDENLGVVQVTKNLSQG